MTNPSPRFLPAAAAAALLLLLTAGAAQAGDRPVQVLQAIPYTESSGASETIKGECELQTKVPHFLDEFSDQVELVTGKPDARGRVLELSISQVHAPGGGAWSGAKSMTVIGTLRDGGKVVGSFTATRFSGGGVFGGYKGTCAIVGRCARAIGKDIADWLRDPKPDSRLGDA
jgi:hypothetical protein